MELLLLIRPKQWYKNLVVFLALIFSFNLFDASKAYAALLGFIALCLVSSSNYVLNDIADIKSDKRHPEKRSRPIASGKISVFSGYMISVLLIIAAIIVSLAVGNNMVYYVSMIFIVSTLYSLFAKKEPYADIIMIAVNFVLRAVAGASVIQVYVSPWLILLPFFIAIFLASGKRASELVMLKDKAAALNPVFNHYSLKTLELMLTVSLALIVASFSIYSAENHVGLLAALPFMLYMLFRHQNNAILGSEMARKPELIFKDKRMIAAGLTFCLSIIAIIYFF